MNLPLLTITTLLLAILSSLCVLRLFYILKFGAHRSKPKSAASDTCGLAIFLGSGTEPSFKVDKPHHEYAGGHTTEALALVSGLDFARYTPRTYIISDGDTLSAQKAHELEERKRVSGG
jgi:beta-1,4-N-acetylglucosaminyltransferase